MSLYFDHERNPASPTLIGSDRHNEIIWPLLRLVGQGRRHARQVDKIANIKPGEQVIELGAGYPFLYRLYSKKVGPTGNFYAVDINERITRRSEKISKILDTIFLLRRTRGREVYIRADANNLPYHTFKDNSMDVVIASNLTAGYGNYYAYKESSRVLRPGGRIVVSITEEDSDHEVQDKDAQHLEQLGFTNIKKLEGTEFLGVARNRFVIAEKPVN